VTLVKVGNLWPPFGGEGEVIEPPDPGTGPTWFDVVLTDSQPTAADVTDSQPSAADVSEA
jgi:hypothetical protein